MDDTTLLILSLIGLAIGGAGIYLCMKYEFADKSEPMKRRGRWSRER